MGNVLGVSSKSNIPFICCPLSNWEVGLLALNTCLFNCSSKFYFHVFNSIYTLWLSGTMHSVHWSIISPPWKPSPPLAKPPLKRQTAQAPLLLRQSSPLHWFFWTPLPKSRIFQWTPKYLSFSSLTPSHLLKVTKFLGIFSQFEFLVLTEKIVLLLNCFCH